LPTVCGKPSGPKVRGRLDDADFVGTAGTGCGICVAAATDGHDSASPVAATLSPPVSVAPPPGPRTPRCPIYSPPQALRAKCWATCCALHGIFQSLSRMSPLTRHRRSWVQAARMFGAAPAPAIPMKFSNSIGTGAKPALRSSNTASSQGTTIAYEGGRSDLQSTAPSLPRSARMQGPGVLEAVTSQQGTMENLRVLTGIPCRLALLRPQQRTGRGRDANHVNFSPSGS